MVLSMPSPYKHPATGVYWLRQRVPARLSAIAKGLMVTVTAEGMPSSITLGAEIKVSLRTKDPIEAKHRGRAFASGHKKYELTCHILMSS